MVPIQRFVLYAALAYSTLLLITLVVIRWAVFYPQDLQYARQIQQKELNTLRHALAADAGELGLTTDDYAQWDDMWDFVQDNNQKFLDVNFVPETFESLNLNAASLLNLDKQQLFGFAYDGEELHRHDGKNASEAIRGSTEKMLTERSWTSYEEISGNLFLVAASPVLHSNESGPQVGWLLFYRQISTEYVKMISQRIQLPIELIPVGDYQNVNSLIERVEVKRSVCMRNMLSVPVFCMQITHDEKMLPELMSWKLFTSFLFLSFVPVGILFIILRRIIKPIVHATHFLNKQNTDQLQIFNYKTNIKELEDLARVYNRIAKKLNRYQDKLKRTAQTDALTGIANRNAFEDAFKQTWRRLNHRKSSAAIVMVDIDFFKLFNDNYGHQHGDMALAKVAKTLSDSACRQDEICARYGGEEFIMLVYLDDAIEMNRFRLHLQETVEKLSVPHEFSPISRHLTISFGIAWIRDSGPWMENLSPEQWIKEADNALYDAKESGRNQGMLRIIARECPLNG